ncbi:MAG: hypothetical protein WAW02_07545 [Sideroxyarcus sp.]
MKRDRRAEGEKILRNAEHSLCEVLLEILPEVVISGEPLFTNLQFNSQALPVHLLSKQGEALFQSASACVEMREALDLPVGESVGRLFLDTCAESASESEHRRGPRKLATALLEKLKHVA